MAKWTNTIHFGLALILALSFSGCGELDEGARTSYSIKDFPGTVTKTFPAKFDIGKTGGTWHGVTSIELRSYNPFASMEGSAYSGVIQFTFDPLFDYNVDKREWIGYMVKNFEVKMDKEKDTMELNCELRDDIYWSDGVQMTTDDVVFYHNELEGNKDIYFRGYAGQMVKMDDGSEKQIKCQKIDKYRFKYIFPRIVGEPTLLVNGYIFPKHIFEPALKKGVKEVLGLWGINTPPAQIICNGPYVLDEYKPAERIVFKSNPRYWKKDAAGNRVPYVDKIVSTFIPGGNSTAALLKFQKGDVDSFGMRGKDMATLLPDAQKKGYDIINGGPALLYTSMIFNQEPGRFKDSIHKLFIDKRFRHAVSSLLDRQTIINQVVNGFATPFYHFVLENNKYYNPKYATPYHYNPEKAKEIFDEMGLKDTNSDSFLEDAEGNTVEFKIMSWSTDQSLIDIINIIIDDLKKVGIKASMEAVDINEASQKFQYTHDWQCYLSALNSPTFPLQWTNVWPSYGDRNHWYPNQKKPFTAWQARIDELHKQIIYTYDSAEMKKLYDEFQEIIMEELPIIPLYRRYIFTAVYQKWGNYIWDGMHDNDGLMIYPEYLYDKEIAGQK